MILIFWLLLIPLALADQGIMTALVRVEYLRHHDRWEKDGNPRGMFWIPPECKIGRFYVTYASFYAFQGLYWRWLFRTPSWVIDERDAHLFLVLHRALVPLIWACAAGPFVLAALG
jgi:hypothetical protein